jgi:hypothetical protein
MIELFLPIIRMLYEPLGFIERRKPNTLPRFAVECKPSYLLIFVLLARGNADCHPVDLFGFIHLRTLLADSMLNLRRREKCYDFG